MADRYFIDERCGFIAIRDTLHPEYDSRFQGVDEPDIVWFENGENVVKTCKECGNQTRTTRWQLKPGARARAEAKLKELTS